LAAKLIEVAVDIGDLGAEEVALMQEVESYRGVLEQRFERLDAAGVFERYKNVHRGYVELAQDKPQDLEPLKRAIFLQWYPAAEPATFTGVFEVSRDASQKAFALLEDIVERGALDDEFKDMLAWYCLVAGWYFELEGRETLNSHILALRDWRFARGEAFDGFPTRWAIRLEPARGQMGTYFASVARSHA
jgi:hypothetical protein